MYRTRAYIADAVRSVLGQTFEDWELVVVDDASPEEDWREVAATSDDPRIRTLVLERNRGISGARNEGLQIARGRYVVPLDADDWLLPTYLEEVDREFRARPGLAVVSPDARLQRGSDGVDIADTSFPADLDRRVPHDRQLVTLLETNYLVPMSAIRADALRAVGGWDEEWSGIEDRELWIRTAAAGYEIGVIERPLAVYRVRGDSVSHRADGSHAQDPRRVALLSSMLDRLALNDQERRAARHAVATARSRAETIEARSALVEGRARVARAHALAAARARPRPRSLAILAVITVAPRASRRAHAMLTRRRRAREGPRPAR